MHAVKCDTTGSMMTVNYSKQAAYRLSFVFNFLHSTTAILIQFTSESRQ